MTDKLKLVIKFKLSFFSQGKPWMHLTDKIETTDKDTTLELLYKIQEKVNIINFGDVLEFPGTGERYFKEQEGWSELRKI